MFVRMQGEHMLELQGRWEEIDREWIGWMMEVSPAPVGWDTWLAAVEAHAGPHEDAVRRVARLAADGCAALPEDVNWHVVCDLAEAVCALGDRTVAEVVRRRLLPHAELYPVVARGVLLYGSAEHHLGRLAAVLGRHDEAAARLRRAVAENERVGAGFRALLSRAELGNALTAAGDGTAAARMLTGVVEEARARGTPGVATAAERRLAALRGGAPA
jgi:hypothetical protein